MTLLGAADIRSLAATVGVRPSKARGQNFVVDGNTIRRIVRLADLTGQGVVLEVGPGLGSLTLGLLAGDHQVVAVEIDPALADQLPATVTEFLPDASGRLSVITADAGAISHEIADEFGPPTALVANLPYNVLTKKKIFPLSEPVLHQLAHRVEPGLLFLPAYSAHGARSILALCPKTLPRRDKHLVDKLPCAHRHAITEIAHPTTHCLAEAKPAALGQHLLHLLAFETFPDKARLPFFRGHP